MKSDAAISHRFGESHGQALVTILEGMLAGVAIDFDAVTARAPAGVRTGYGCGRRMAIESDRAQILSGVRHGLTTGGPVALLIRNKDWENWQKTMVAELKPPADATGADRPSAFAPAPATRTLPAS